jgi:hypothetical protein
MENRKSGQSYDKAIILDDDLDIRMTSNTSTNTSQPLCTIPPARKRDYDSDETTSGMTPSVRPRLRKNKRIQGNKIVDVKSTSRTGDRKQPPTQEQQKLKDGMNDRKQPPTQDKPTAKTTFNHELTSSTDNQKEAPTQKKQETQSDISDQRQPYVQGNQEVPKNCRLLVLHDQKQPVGKTWPKYSLHMKFSSRDINCHLKLVRTNSYIESDGDIGEDTLHNCIRLLPSGEKLLLIDDSLSYMTKDLPRLQESYPLYYELILNKIANFELQDYDDAKWPLFRYIGKKYVTQTCSRGICAIEMGLSLRERHWTLKQWKELRRHISKYFVPSFCKHDRPKIMNIFTSREHAGEWFRAIEKTIELAEFFVRSTWKVASKIHKNKQELSKAMDLIKQWADTRLIEWQDTIESNQSRTQE